jgi:hypothetical protein
MSSTARLASASFCASRARSTGGLHPFVQDGERARIAVDRGTPNAFATQSAVMSA